jgi:two-component system NtrC family sensor kinase
MRSLSTRLILWMGGALALVFLSLNAAYLLMSRHSLEETSIATADRIADVIQRSTRYSMLKNSRDDVYETIHSIGAQPVVRRIRVFNKLGQINYSTASGEMHTYVDRNAEACAGCHLSSQPLERLPRPDRARIYRLAGERVVGVIRPIENEPACSNASCHAHPPTQRILGVLDVVLSLEPVDQSLRQQERRSAGLILVGGGLLLLLLSVLVWKMVRRPVKQLTTGVQYLAAGDLKYRFRFQRNDEIGKLAGAFNHMAGELDQAREEITGWNRDLERRVLEKSRELERAQERLIHSEKLASLGQLAAAVAHEINNPLAGILTYARLAAKKIPPDSPACAWLETIQHESKRCGEIVRNLLAFSRQRPVEMAPADAVEIIEHALDVVRHKLALQQIAVETRLAPGLPSVLCDASQIQQVLVTLAVNATEALVGTEAGRLCITATMPESGWVEIAVTNNGPPIPPDALPHIFEPFFTTKQQTSGVGLGLAVAYGILKRHNGEILVETGRETTFRVRLPVTPSAPLPELAPILTEQAVPAERGSS